MSKIHEEFSLHLCGNNNEGQFPVVKLVEIGNSYLIHTLDKHSGLLLLHKRIIYVSFSVQTQGSYGTLSMFQDRIFMFTDEKKQLLTLKSDFIIADRGTHTIFFIYWSPLTEIQKDLRSKGCLSIIKLQLSQSRSICQKI